MAQHLRATLEEWDSRAAGKAHDPIPVMITPIR
jgi:hypothetical protein